MGTRTERAREWGALPGWLPVVSRGLATVMKGRQVFARVGPRQAFERDRRLARVLAFLAALVTVAVSLLGAGPASAMAPPSTYDTAAYVYDASSRLSTPHASAAVGGSPVASAEVSWVSSVLSGGFGVAANAGAELCPA